jgi:hypothetical protein
MRVRALALSVAVLVGFFGSVKPAQATFIVQFSDVGSNVVATGSGSINTTALTSPATFSDAAGFVIPSDALEITQPNNTGGTEFRATGFAGPTSFGSGTSRILASFGSGDVVGIQGAFGGFVGLPNGYVSGALC